MNETQQRIAHYKKLLPKMKERVIAVALLLALSLTMVTTVSFAWMVLSKAPEVSGVSTTIAANGNLEIALASGNRNNLTAPGASQVGDSGLELLQRNITWGNLINLTDPAYGLDNLVLRPAQLNDTALLTSPLYGAVYSTDGRIERLTSNFSYTAWIPAQGTTPGYFGISNDLGVRAISSVKRELVGFQGQYTAMREAADIANVAAGNAFKAITEKSAWMTSLATMIGTHMTATLNYEEEYINASVKQEDLENLIDMYEAFIAAHELEAQAIASALNMQLFLAWGGATENYTPVTDREILALSVTSSSGDYTRTENGKTLKIVDLKSFIADYKLLTTDVEQLKAISASGDYRWTASGLKTIIGRLVNINSCIVDGQTVTALLNSFTSNPLTALGYKNKEVSCVITNGVLYNFEQRVGTTINVSPSGSGKKGLPVTAIMYVDTMSLGEQKATIYATITTSASKPADFTQDLIYGDTLNTGADNSAGEAVAQDTYGLAVDFWVRTNAQSTYLILEGNVLTTETIQEVKGKSATGEEVNLYTLSRTENIQNEDGSTSAITFSYDLYKVVTPAEGNTPETTTWYLHDDHSVFTLNANEAPAQKMETITTVIGYEGENRVWDENNALLNPDATTQGTGSCYVYYADTPEDQARSLRLLEAFNIAFVDQNGNLLATAKMDTEHYFAESGRVTVPLMLNGDGVNLGDNEYAITALEKNVPMLITALVYLDGTKLTNDEVLAAADIQGQLNIQFGSSAELNAIDNEELATKERSVTASVTPNTFDYDTATSSMTATVTVNVAGDQPNTVTAFFLRKINSSQGSRERVMTFTKGEGGTWTANYTFEAPGNYVLRSVMLDGVEYDLPMSDSSPLPTVTVNGFTIRSLVVNQANNARHLDVMTAAGSSSVDVTLNFATNDVTKMPSTVAGRFLRADGTAANINFTYNPTSNAWVGKATFVTSGDYTLRYLVLNGEYVELPETMWHTATVNLGMKVAVYTTSPTTFLYKPGDWKVDGEFTDEGFKKANLGMQVIIMNNAGEKMPSLSGVTLNYGKSGTGIVEQGLNTNLTWNPSSEYYEGSFQSKIGMYNFLNVSVGGNTITNATISPSFKIASPVTPAFSQDISASYQFVPDRTAALKVNIKNCEVATVTAILTHTTNSGTSVLTVPGTLSTIAEDIATWAFNLPKDQAQDGVWSIQEIHLSDVYAADGTEYTAENPLIFDLTGKAVSSKVVETMKVVIEKPANFDAELGKDGSTITGTFMQEYELSGLKVSFTDAMGQPLQGTLTASVVYDYLGDSQDKGGYSGATKTDSLLSIALTSSDGKTFTQTGSQKVYLAGTYTPKLVYTINGTQITISADQMGDSNLSFTIWSKAPTVKISARSSYGSSTNTETSATVYFNSSSSACGTNYSQPYVSITLAGKGAASSAYMQFAATSGGTVHLYTSNGGSTATSKYEWTADGACQRWVGYYKSKTAGTDDKTAAGNLKATTLILVYNGSEYSVNIGEITISNPS